MDTHIGRAVGSVEGEASTRQTIAIVSALADALILQRRDLIAALAARGHRVICLAPQMNGRVRQELQSIGAEPVEIELARMGLNPFSAFQATVRLARLLRRLRPDLIMGYHAKGAISATIAGWLAGVPKRIPLIAGLGYAFSVQDGGRRLVRAAMMALYALAFRVATGAIFHNRDNAELLSAAKVLPSKLNVFVVAGSGVDLSRFPARPLPTTKNGFVFVSVCRLMRQKGVLEYAAAARRLKVRHPAARFVLVGPREVGPASLSDAELDEVRAALDYVGPSDDIARHLAAAHVFVLPSYYGEGVPRTILEALATGRAIITTDAPGCRETVDPGSNGLLVPVRDAVALEAAMERFILEPDLAQNMGERSLELARQRFDVALVNRSMMVALGLEPQSQC